MAARSMEAQSFGLDATGQNIANVNTPGYTRRVVSSVAVPTRGIRSAGDGVDIGSISGERAPFLEGRILNERPVVAREKAITDTLGVIEASLGKAGESIDAALTSFYDSFATLADDPTSSNARYQVAAQGQALATKFHDLASRLVSAQHDADSTIVGATVQINNITAALASINTQLAGANPSLGEALKDQQNALLGQLSDLIDITTVVHSDGSLDILAGNGLTVVAADHSYALTTTAVPPNGLADIQINGTSVTNQITGGKIGGLLHVRDVMIPAYQTQLDNLAYGVANKVNTVHQTGFDLNGNPGGNFFNAIAAAPAGAAAAIAMNPAILANTATIAAGAVALPGDNQVARALANLRSTTITGGTQNPLDTWASLVYQVASDLNASSTETSNHSDIVRQLQSARDQFSGVSLDEEAANMMKFQRAYEANARFFATINQALEALINTV